MKIGIVTVEKSANVGSFLQAYAPAKGTGSMGGMRRISYQQGRKAFLKENIAGLYLREEI